MGQYLETVRSVVSAWECDAVEHFTTPYYFDRFSRATQHMLMALGYSPHNPSLPSTRDCFVRYLRELRKNDVFHIDTGVIDYDDNRIVFGHRVIDSETGELCTTMEQVLDGPAKSDPTRHRVDWDGPQRETRSDAAADATWLPTAMDVVRESETNWSGSLDLSAYIHRFAAASVQSQSLFGMSPSYMREHRIGFSTFEFQLDFSATPPEPGHVLETKSTVVNIGRTSMHLLHRMTRAPAGTPVAALIQLGVHLDLDKRRPAPLPEALVHRARRLMGGSGARIP